MSGLANPVACLLVAVVPTGLYVSISIVNARSKIIVRLSDKRMKALAEDLGKIRQTRSRMGFEKRTDLKAGKPDGGMSLVPWDDEAVR